MRSTITNNKFRMDLLDTSLSSIFDNDDTFFAPKQLDRKRERQSFGLAGNGKKIMRPNGTTPKKMYVTLSCFRFNKIPLIVGFYNS